MGDLAAALQIAIEVHAGQRDKQGDPYLFHVCRVVAAVSDEAKVVAALHDVCEDGGRDPWSFEDEFGMPVAAALEVLSRSDKETYADYIQGIAEGYAHCAAVCREVKLADIRDNLGRIPARESTKACGAGCYCTWENEWVPLKARYEKALATLEAASVPQVA